MLVICEAPRWSSHSDREEVMTTLFGWGPMFGNPSPSPYVLKCDIQLQMLGLTFDRAIADLEAVSKHKAPYVEHNGEILEDSTFIRHSLEKQLGRDLDSGLSDEQRSASWALERLLEDHLNQIMLFERWLEADNFERGPIQFFAGVPAAVLLQVANQARDSLRLAFERTGLGRYSREERMSLASLDLQAVSRALGEQLYMFGSEPTALDASAYGALVSCTAPIFDSPLRDMVLKHANLRDYIDRMADRFMKDAAWPQMAG